VVVLRLYVGSDRVIQIDTNCKLEIISNIAQRYTGKVHGIAH